VKVCFLASLPHESNKVSPKLARKKRFSAIMFRESSRGICRPENLGIRGNIRRITSKEGGERGWI